MRSAGKDHSDRRCLRHWGQAAAVYLRDGSFHIMAVFGKTSLELYKEIAMCPPEVFPPYNVSHTSDNIAAKVWLHCSNLTLPFTGRACETCAKRDPGAQASAGCCFHVSFWQQCHCFAHTVALKSRLTHSMHLLKQCCELFQILTTCSIQGSRWEGTEIRAGRHLWLSPCQQ